MMAHHLADMQSDAFPAVPDKGQDRGGAEPVKTRQRQGRHVVYFRQA